MKLHLVLDPAYIVDMYLPQTDSKRRQRVTRMNRHILVGSRELSRVWGRLLEQPPFRENSFLQESLGDWLNDILNSPSKYRAVTLDETSNVQGEPSELEKVLLDTAYASLSKIIVADIRESIRLANPELIFVSKDAFSQEPPNSVTIQQIETVVRGTCNLKNDLFAVFETPINFFMDNDDAELLAQYLAHFYDQNIVIQDNFLVSNEKNEANFQQYILPHLKTGSEITIRVKINPKDLAQQEKLNKMKAVYEAREDYKIRLEATSDKIHDGYIETTDFRITIPYRMFVFGKRGKTTDNRIQIWRK